MKEYHNMTLAEHDDIYARFTEIRKLVKENEKYIRISRDEELAIIIVGLKGNPAFFFKVSEPRRIERKVVYTLKYSPRNRSNNKVYEHASDSDKVISVLKQWLVLMQHHLTKKSLHPVDEISNQYEEEFQEWYKFVDSDADTKAFNVKQQILIDTIIDRSLKVLKENGIDEDDEVVKQAVEIRNNLSKLTKNQVFEKIKVIYPKLVKLGVPVLKKITKVCTETMISMGYQTLVKTLSEGIFQFLV